MLNIQRLFYRLVDKFASSCARKFAFFITIFCYSFEFSIINIVIQIFARLQKKISIKVIILNV